MRVRYGWSCGYDEMSAGVSSVRKKCRSDIKLINRFDMLQLVDNSEQDKSMDSVEVSPT